MFDAKHAKIAKKYTIVHRSASVFFHQYMAFPPPTPVVQILGAGEAEIDSIADEERDITHEIPLNMNTPITKKEKSLAIKQEPTYSFRKNKVMPTIQKMYAPLFKRKTKRKIISQVTINCHTNI
ncbi:MAG: hypothetical protein HAW62_00630 [Endozoicomonadaceae bacterium]|nr:hypothetical protein [Endozoicomonadaceae bacterium]